MKRSLTLFLVIASVGTAAAGYRLNAPTVQLDTAGRWAQGSIADVRSTPDNIQQIGCYIYGYSNRATGYCYARNAESVSVYCWTDAPTALQAIAMVQDGFLSFTWDSVGKCGYIYTDNASRFSPKQP